MAKKKITIDDLAVMMNRSFQWLMKNMASKSDIEEVKEGYKRLEDKVYKLGDKVDTMQNSVDAIQSDVERISQNQDKLVDQQYKEHLPQRTAKLEQEMLEFKLRR